MTAKSMATIPFAQVVGSTKAELSLGDSDDSMSRIQ
jgi:hypothetical protein